MKKLLAKSKTFHENIHVNDVVTDWSSALAEFFVSTLLVFLPANPSIFPSKCFSSQTYTCVVADSLNQSMV